MDTTGRTITGGPSVTTTGINAGGTVITNVAPGVAGTDATNVDQLNAVSTVANAGWNVTTAATGTGTATGTTVQNIAPGGTATFTAGNNIAITQNGAETQIATSMTPSFTSVTVGDTVINDGSVSFTSGGPSITNGGIDAGGTVITNVAPGVAGTDAANVSQVTNLVDGAKTHYYSVNDGGTVGGNFANDGATGVNAVASGVNATAAGDAAVAMGFGAAGSGLNAISIGTNAQATNSGSIAIGQNTVSTGPDTIAIGTGASATNSVALGAGASAGAGGTALGDGANATVAGGVALGKNSVEGAANATASTTIAGTTYNFAGTAPTSVVSVGAVGAERQITNVAAGRLSATSTDAINGSQLYATNQAIDQVAATANAGWNISDGTNSGNVAPGATLTVAAGSNATTAYDSATGTLTVGVVADPSFNSIVVGGTSITTNGLTITGGPSVTTAGIDAGGTTITNVAAGTNATDAVNVSQLSTATAAVQTHYYSVNDGGTVGGNYANDGATGTNSLAAGVNATATGTRSAAMGYGATASASDALALGAGATAGNAGDVALGAGSVTAAASPTLNTTIAGTTYAFAGANPTSVVSVGSAGAERQVTNVAAGRLSGTSTDAVNGSQLYATNQAIESGLGSLSTTISTTRTHYYSVNDNGVVGGNYDNDGATGVNSLAAGVNAAATGAGSMALGAGASAVNANDVALGAGSVTAAANPTAGATIGGVSYGFAGALPTSVVSMGSVGAERQITNVAAGRLSGTSTDAVNGSQLYAVSEAINTLSTSTSTAISSLSTGLTVVQGDVTSLSTSTSTSLSTLVASAAPSRYYSVNDGGTQQGNYQNNGATGANSMAAGINAVASGADSVAIGSGANAGSDGATVIGAKAIVSADNGVAMGSNASVTGANSVALGANSVADEANTVSVGSSGSERRITNVAPGVNSTDAVNVSQLRGVQQNINHIAKKAYAGVAGATALTMIPDVDAGKKFALGLGVGNYQGTAATAIGFTARLTENIKLRGGVSASSSGSTAGVGVSYQW
jgi:autotransporter adhesin